MSFKKVNINESYFEGILQCDAIKHYSHKCEKCGKIYITPNDVNIPKCMTCGHKKVKGPIPIQCTETERTGISRYEGRGEKKEKTGPFIAKKFNESDEALIKKHYGIEAEQLVKQKWYCEKHQRNE